MGMWGFRRIRLLMMRRAHTSECLKEGIIYSLTHTLDVGWERDDEIDDGRAGMGIFVFHVKGCFKRGCHFAGLVLGTAKIGKHIRGV
jgi:hypothetical protein